MLRVAERLQLAAQLRDGMSRALVASIGPTTSETLHEFDFQVDVEPELSRMGQLVAAAARKASEKSGKQQPANRGPRFRRIVRVPCRPMG